MPHIQLLSAVPHSDDPRDLVEFLTPLPVVPSTRRRFFSERVSPTTGNVSIVTFGPVTPRSILRRIRARTEHLMSDIGAVNWRVAWVEADAPSEAAFNASQIIIPAKPGETADQSFEVDHLTGAPWLEMNVESPAEVRWLGLLCDNQSNDTVLTHWQAIIDSPS